MLEEASFYKKLLEQIKQCFIYMAITKIDSILCYGLGNFTSSSISRYQLAVLLLLKDYFHVNVYIYDPIFTENEVNFLIKFNIKIIEQNEAGFRKIDNITLVFLPHCPTKLINNLLWSNWNRQLSKCIVLGNSFTRLAEYGIERDFKEKYFYVHSILPAIKELEIENNFRYTDIFNDISLHIFLHHILLEFPEVFWENNPKPLYNDNDIEYISSKLSTDCIID